MKKIRFALILALVALMAVALVACGDEPAPGPGTEPPAPAAKITVTTMVQGTPAVLQFDEGATLKSIPDPSVKGYDFIEWCSDAALATKVEADAALTSGMLLYAKFEAHVYTAEYIIGENPVDHNNPLTYTILTAGKLACPINNGMIITWKDEDDNVVTNLAAVLDDITLYGYWTKLPYISVDFESGILHYADPMEVTAIDDTVQYYGKKEGAPSSYFKTFLQTSDGTYKDNNNSGYTPAAGAILLNHEYKENEVQTFSLVELFKTVINAHYVKDSGDKDHGNALVYECDTTLCPLTEYADLGGEGTYNSAKEQAGCFLAASFNEYCNIGIRNYVQYKPDTTAKSFEYSFDFYLGEDHCLDIQIYLRGSAGGLNANRTVIANITADGKLAYGFDNVNAARNTYVSQGVQATRTNVADISLGEWHTFKAVMTENEQITYSSLTGGYIVDLYLDDEKVAEGLTLATGALLLSSGVANEFLIFGSAKNGGAHEGIMIENWMAENSASEWKCTYMFDNFKLVDHEN